MLPKERVLATLQHREPDRVPTGEIGIDYTITEQALGHPTLYRAKWKEYQALWQGRRDEYVESCKRDLVEIVRKLEWDFVPVFLVPPRNAMPNPPRFIDKYTWVETDGRIMRFSPETEGLPVCVQFPPLSPDTIRDESVHLDPSQFELVDHVVHELGDSHFIVGRGGDGSYPYEYYGIIEILTAMIDNPALVHRAVEVETQRAITVNEALLDAGCDAVLPGDDYCSSKGPMMSPAHFRTYILPGLTALVESAHSKGKYLIKHTDGNTWPIFDMLVEAGIDGWHGIQTKVGMDLGKLKAEYGDSVCLFGGVDVDWLIEGTPEQVRQVTRSAIDSAGNGGGLVVTSGNTIMVGVRCENYLAMLETIRTYGAYPLRQEGRSWL